LLATDRYRINSATCGVLSTYQIFMVQNDIEIKKVVDEWAQAIRDGNIDGILYRHTTEAVMFDVPMPLQNVGLEEYKKTWELFFRYSHGGEGSFELIDLKIISSDSVAFCYGLLKIGGQVPECRLTLGLQKINNN